MSSAEKRVVLKTSPQRAWEILRSLAKIGEAFPFVSGTFQGNGEKTIWKLKPPADTLLRSDDLEASTLFSEIERQHTWQARSNSYTLTGVLFLESVESGGTDLLVRLVTKTEGFMSRFLGAAFTMNLDDYLEQFVRSIEKTIEDEDPA